jgi:hypothetical protein
VHTLMISPLSSSPSWPVSYAIPSLPVRSAQGRWACVVELVVQL